MQSRVTMLLWLGEVVRLGWWFAGWAGMVAVDELAGGKYLYSDRYRAMQILEPRGGGIGGLAFQGYGGD